MEEGYERTRIKAESLKEEHDRKFEREKQRHDNIMEELKFMAKHKITIFSRQERRD
jgi:hypothetical protein